MGKLVDLTGQRFGRLVVIERAEKPSSRFAMWLCLCDCGKTTIVSSGNLRNGHTQSCGCLRREVSCESNTTHGQYGTRLYRIWYAMKTRTTNPNSMYYKNYGGRGITVCAEWLHDFAAFQKWAMSHGYRDDLTIDRIDNDKGYSPDNCRWATMKEQRHNRRDT